MTRDRARLPVLEVALNGSRDHAETPRTAEQLAEAARAAVEEGARVIHMHPYDAMGRETLAAESCAAALKAVRAACPGVPVSLSTSSEIEPDPRARLDLIARWRVQPDLVSANQGEAGIEALCEYLMARGVGIEAGILSVADAEAFALSDIKNRCVRVLVEPLDADSAAALAHAAAIEQVLMRAGVSIEQVHHGDGLASWAVNSRALERGHGIRTGLEDTTVLPDGRPTRDNSALVRAAVAMIADASKRLHDRPEARAGR